MSRAEDVDAIVAGILNEIVEEERAFSDTVAVGDVVTWSEWVWSRSITGDAHDPEESERVMFTGTVASVTRAAHGVTVSVDPASVAPGPGEVRQRPRCTLPARAFEHKQGAS